MRNLLIGAVLVLGFHSSAQTLKVGDSAPSLPVAKWIKGQPVKEFEQGKVYVVEFWATWCGPCRRTIPHLTKLAEKYKDKATIVGVSIWERVDETNPEAHIQRVEQFVQQMGDQMKYVVAVDGVDGATAKAWMVAAGQNGVPTAFVVDQQRRIVWIGHPMAGLDKVLEQVIAGNFDWQAEAARLNAELERQRRLREQRAAIERDYAEFSQLMRQNKHEDALKKLDEMISRYPELSGLKLVRFETLARVDEQQAYAYARQLAQNELKDDAIILNQLAWRIVDDNTKLPLKNPDYQTAIIVARRAVELTQEKDPMILDTLAYAYFKHGDVRNALKYQKMAVDLLEQDTSLDESAKEEIRERYERFKKAAEKSEP
ncbi:MAG: redoxin domain-containing protein [Armatimonadota bacterium]|nr:redoxin domain-containing protein [Armatimonadota bacterium]